MAHKPKHPKPKKPKKPKKKNMAFQVVGSRADSVTALNAATHNITLPSGIVAGDLLVCVLTIDGTTGSSAPTFAGWESFAVAAGAPPHHEAFYRKATGTDPTEFLTASSQKATHRTWRFTSATVADPDVVGPQGGGATGSGTAPDPPDFNPMWTSGNDTTWLATCGRDDDDSVSQSYPTNYTDGFYHESDTANGSVEAAYAERDLSTGGAENPGVFDLGNTAEQWGALTLAIPPSGAAPPSLDIIQQSFRWRDTDPAINANGGGDWAAAKDVDITSPVLDTFPVSGRLRIGLRNSSGGTINVAYELWVSKDGGAYKILPAQATPWAASVTQREVMLVGSASFTNGAATTEILADAGTFVAGEGRESNPTGLISLDDGEDTELEFKLLFRKLSGDGHVPDATTFDFQIRDATGTQILGTYTETPRLTIANKPGHIGGAIPETPSNLLIIEDTGVLYTAIEATDDSSGTVVNELVVMKSTDGGDTWTTPDFANRPGDSFNDLEALDVQYIAGNDQLYIVWQGPNTDSVYYVEFNTSGHASPDEYGTVEAVDEAVTPPTFSRQFVTFRRRASDGIGWIAYGDNNGTDDQISIKKRLANGTWDGSPTNLDGETENIGGGMMEIDSSNIIHILYMVTRGTATDADLYHRSINTSETLSGRTAANDSDQDMTGDSFTRTIPHTPPRIYDDGGTEKIGVAFITNTKVPMFTQSPVDTIAFIADELITTTTVASSAGTSGQAQMALAWDDVDDEPILLFTDETDESLLKIISRPVSTWTGEATHLDLTNVIGWVRGRVFVHSGGNGGARVFGYITDEHFAPGGTGGLRYREIERAAGGGQTIAVGVLAETNTLVVVAAEKPIDEPVGVLAGTDVLIPVDPEKTANIGTLAGTDTLIPVAADKPIDTPVSTLAGTDVLIPVDPEKTANIGTLAGTDVLIPVAADKPIFQAVGTLAQADTLIPVAAEKLASIGTLAEVGILIPIAVQQPGETDVGTLAELDSMIPVDADKPILRAVGTIGELNALVAISADKPIITAVGTIGGLDSLIPIPPVKPIDKSVGTLGELDALITIEAVPEVPQIIPVGTLVETDSLISVQVILGLPPETVESPGKPVTLEPSTVDLVVRWLKGNTAVSALVGTNVSSTLPVEDSDITYPWITVKRLIGLPVLPEAGLDNARIQFIAHGGVTTSGAPKWVDCDLVIRTINQQIKQTLKVVVTGRGIIRSLSGLEGIQQLEDPDTGGAMFWMDAIIVAQGV